METRSPRGLSLVCADCLPFSGPRQVGKFQFRIDGPESQDRLHPAACGGRNSYGEVCRKTQRARRDQLLAGIKARRMSFTTCSAGSLADPEFCLIFAPSKANDDPEILPSSIR